MHDGITFEKHGIPAAVICTEPFVRTAKSMARIHGIPDYGFVVLPHPMGSLTADQVQERARTALPGVIELLLGR
ncbi:MAG: hypothetical protein IIB12_00995 [Chloroflexi bacterium]|nr:hypothetical protein [Chloroflexota bacterium]MCH8284856.1 hypothetical protein [Chloroflexota bacterium]